MEKKNYEVIIHGSMSVAVEGAVSKEDAEQIAQDAASTGDFQLNDFDTREVSEGSWESCVRCSDAKALDVDA